MINKPCIVCGYSNPINIPSKVSSFISEYIYNGKKIECNLILCPNCSFVFFDKRFNSEEEKLLYSDYRGDNYVKIRDRNMPGYADVNELIGINPVEIKNRKDNLDKILRLSLKGINIKKVLDYGGDSGQFIPEICQNSSKYVYDLSQKRTLQGIKKISNPFIDKPYDFVMCSHVLEHSSAPNELIVELLKLASDDGLIYLEVPWESYYYGLIKLLHIFSKININIFNLLVGFLPKMQLIEHLNYFTCKSISTLLNKNNLQILYIKVIIIDMDWIKMPVLSVLMKKIKSKDSHKANYLSYSMDYLTWVYIIFVYIKNKILNRKVVGL